jgi:hypothetical protein
MMPEPIHYELQPDPWALRVLLGTMTSTAVGGAIWLFRRLWRSREARSMLAKVLEDPKEAGDESALMKTLIQLLRNQDADRQADRQERVRQWERVEDVLNAIRDQAAETRELVTTISNVAGHFQQLHDNQANTLQRIEQSQVGLATWVYQNLRGGQPLPPFFQSQQGR